LQLPSNGGNAEKQTAQKKKFDEAHAKEKAAKASTASANNKEKDSAVMRSEATKVVIASSAKHSAEDNLSICEEVPLSKQTKVSEHLKAVQVK